MNQDKKVLITTLNAKYSQTSLACRYLTSELINNGIDAHIKEFSINIHRDKILEDLVSLDFNIYAFSTYIWNVEMTLYLCKNLKKIKPKCTIILGGPEVSFNPTEMFDKEPAIDFIVCGEGEGVFLNLIKSICQGHPFDSCFVATKSKPTAQYNIIKDLDQIPFAYFDLEKLEKNRLVYYETSRGCIYNCSYCLSCISKGMRFLNLDRVKAELEVFNNAGVKILKFVDRTFNVNKTRAMEIMNHIISLKNPMRAHFEICAHLIDDEFLEFLKTVPKDIFQFEIGIQSTNKKTLEAVNRNTDLGRALYVCRELKKSSNIEMHLDLIAGLPFDTYADNLAAIDEVFDACDIVFLGFLKILNGSIIKQQTQEFEYKYDECAPYICFENKFISYKELKKLKQIDFIIDRYNNSKDFKKSIDFLISYYKRPSVFLSFFSDYLESIRFFDSNKSKDSLYLALYECMKNVLDKDKFFEFEELLRFDFIKNQSGVNPSFINREYGSNFRNNCDEFLKDKKNLLRYISDLKDLPIKEIVKKIRFHKFNFKNKTYVYIIFTKKNNAVDITADFLNCTEV